MKITGLQNTHCKAMAGIERLTVHCNTAMVYALNAVSRLFRTQGSAGTVNTAHALIGELSKQAKKDIARQKQDKGHEV